MEKKKKSEGVTVTRAEKKDRTKNLIREALMGAELKHNDLIDKTAKAYSEHFEGEETENINDVRGRIGSVLDIMKKDGEIVYEGGVYALKKEETAPVKKNTRKKAEKEAEKTEKPKTKTTRAKKQEKKEEEILSIPVESVPAPVETTQPVVEKAEKTPKKRGKTKKVEKKETETPEPVIEEKTEEAIAEAEKQEVAEGVSELLAPVQEVIAEPLQEEVKEETKTEAIIEEKKEAEKSVVDMSFLFGAPKPLKAIPTKVEERKQPVQEKTEKAEEKKQETVTEKPSQKLPVKQEKTEKKREAPQPIVKEKTPQKPIKKEVKEVKKPTRTLTADEKLKEAFIKRLHKLGGDYFEYYSVYLLERYSRLNGRRLEGLKITAGDRDGGIDGEIELTDKFGFRETIYVQSKNWDPEKGDEKLWVVGETLLQQFIGACVCRQAKDGKQHCRGIFITTSRFTAEAKALLNDMSEKIIGYDGTDLFEAAKECSFGLIKRNGEWVLDEDLLSGGKAFFNLF